MNQQVLHQLEYYFGDRNLYRDKFLSQQIDSNVDGWVPISVLLTFNRLKAITEEPAVICEAVKGSTLIEADESGVNIRRLPSRPLPTLSKESVLEERARTVHISGFPVDTTMDALLNFSESLGTVLDVRMSRTKKKFTGCVFCVLKEIEDAVNVSQQSDLSFGDVPLTCCMVSEYYAAQENTKKDLEIKSKEAQLEESKVGSVLLRAENLPAEAGIKEIRAFFNFHVPTVFVDRLDPTTGIVRITSDQSPESVREQIMCAVDNNLVMDGSTISLSTPNDEEVGNFWSKYMSVIGRTNGKQKTNKVKRQEKPNKRKVFRDDDFPVSKVQKIEENEVN